MDFLKELPEQIFRDILLRVSYKSQQKIKQLLEPAKEMMECFQFYQDRIKFGLAEKYICLLENDAISVYDPVDQSCIMRTHIPTCFRTSWDSKILCVKHKIVLVGLTANNTEFILIYDVLSSTWEQSVQILTHITRFACCASPEGSIYIAGGRINVYVFAELRGAAVYKLDEDMWELLPEMNRDVGWCRGVFLDGMFYVISTQFNRCQRFDPSTGVWSTVNMAWQSSCSIYVLFGRLIAFGMNSITQYDWEGNVWRELDTLPQELRNDNDSLWWDQIYATVWQDRIFLCGKDKASIDRRTIFYMYKPEAALSERWINMDVPNYLVKRTVRSIDTIEI